MRSVNTKITFKYSIDKSDKKEILKYYGNDLSNIYELTKYACELVEVLHYHDPRQIYFERLYLP